MERTTGSEKVAIARAPRMQANRKMSVALGSAQVMRECSLSITSARSPR